MKIVRIDLNCCMVIEFLMDTSEMEEDQNNFLKYRDQDQEKWVDKTLIEKITDTVPTEAMNTEMKVRVDMD